MIFLFNYYFLFNDHHLLNLNLNIEWQILFIFVIFVSGARGGGKYRKYSKENHETSK